MALIACKTTAISPTERRFNPTQAETPLPSLTIEALRDDIPLADSFPIRVVVKDAPPGEQIQVQLFADGMQVGTDATTLQTNAAGYAELSLRGSAHQPKLVSLDAIGRMEDGGVVTGTLYIDFEPPQEGLFQAQAADDGDIIGSPITIEDYYQTLPVAKTPQDLYAHQENASGVVLDGVRLVGEDGQLEPLDAIMFDVGSESVAMPQATDCTRRLTYINLKTTVDGQAVNFPVNTRVYISDHTYREQVKLVGNNGRLEFYLGCSTQLHFKVLAWTSTGISMHTGEVFNKPVMWKKSERASSGSFNADTVRNRNIQMAPSTASSFSRKSQRLFFRLNQVYNWERKASTVYSSFPVDAFYPYISSKGSLAGIGRIMYADGFALYDAGIYHEFGHEVYYRRMMGASAYNRAHQEAVSGLPVSYPACLGALGWSLWGDESNCAGLLEGWAVFFEQVATARLNTRLYRRTEFRPSSAPSGPRVPGNVAAYLYDIADDSGSQARLKDDDSDAFVRTNEELDLRYTRVANFFRGMATHSSIDQVWQQNIRPDTRSLGTCEAHRRVMVANTITVSSCN
ncbi:hypothetical protein [Truepera radiovictrix]|uniref:hypothetical protein n=1 Tax=Truepera radiovictrix TaxID=332249 RepID=UPI0011D0F3E0|nr:hypothetical protein [Truepera radiovictrix]WMT58431.1 hypothetical protein RCV51_05675 [Truepera radiovictrix]